MELYYEGVDITGKVIISSAKCKDVSGGRCDTAELVFDRPKDWNRWNPKKNDRIIIKQDGYSTGELYVNAIAPIDGKYRIVAAARKTGAISKITKSYEDKSLEDLMRQCAAESGMDYRIYGIDKRLHYDYLIRKSENVCAFLSRIAELEGAVLKTYSGRLTMIGIEAAQNKNAVETIHISPDSSWAAYDNTGVRSRILEVHNCFVTARAVDESADDNSASEVCGLPFTDAATAGRWARGLLLSKNRKHETLTIDTEFHPQWSAMVRVDIDGTTKAYGEWLIDSVDHDFIANTSTAILYRCNRSIK